MATYKKLDTGRWQAQIARQGIRKAKSFKSKHEAQDWATRQEYLISEGEALATKGSLGSVFERYAREVSSSKRGARWEVVRLTRLQKDKIADVRLSDLKAGDFADWRDRRLKEVAAASAKREMVLKSAVITKCTKREAYS
ncbi:MAG: hypothetical protein JXR13_00230 [Thalassovita sp.]